MKKFIKLANVNKSLHLVITEFLQHLFIFSFQINLIFLGKMDSHWKWINCLLGPVSIRLGTWNFFQVLSYKFQFQITSKAFQFVTWKKFQVSSKIFQVGIKIFEVPNSK